MNSNGEKAGGEGNWLRLLLWKSMSKWEVAGAFGSGKGSAGWCLVSEGREVKDAFRDLRAWVVPALDNR